LNKRGIKRAEYQKGWQKANPDKNRVAALKSYYKNPEKSYKSKLKRKYSMTLEQYNQLLKAQSGQCATCPSKPQTRRLNVDHNHKTNKIRGLLCFSCNYTIGFLKDDPARFESIAAYLRKNDA
jgi:hypothetical protein